MVRWYSLTSICHTNTTSWSMSVFFCLSNMSAGRLIQRSLGKIKMTKDSFVVWPPHYHLHPWPIVYIYWSIVVFLDWFPSSVSPPCQGYYKVTMRRYSSPVRTSSPKRWRTIEVGRAYGYFTLDLSTTVCQGRKVVTGWKNLTSSPWTLLYNVWCI